MNQRFTTYRDVEVFLEHLPMFGKTQAAAVRFELEPMNRFLDAIGNPHRDFKSVHVAGTNGKGTVCRLLASVYQEAGYKTGLYTSPHLMDYRDRFMINGERITKDELLTFFQKYGDLVISEQLTYFELSTAVSFWHFSEHSVEIAIVEVGLGGRLDATNVINPEVSVITSIGIDHTDFLGNTLSEIASEKAGIVKKGIPLITGNLKPEAKNRVEKIAQDKGSAVLHARKTDILYTGDHLGFQTSDGKKMVFSLDNWKMADACNFKIVWEVTAILQDRFPVSESRFRDGIIQMNQRFRNRAVFERVSEHEHWYFDGAHNPDAVTELINKLLSIAEANDWKVVLSFMKDKLTPEVAALWNQFPDVYLFDMNTQRAASIAQMMEFFPNATPLSAIPSTRLTHFKSSLVIFSGSFYFYSTVSDWMGTSPA